MLKAIQLSFTYADTGDGHDARDAFKTALDTELTGDNIVPSVLYGDQTKSSAASKTGNVVASSLLYLATNDGISDFNAFWATVDAEYDKATVVKTNDVSSGCKFDCRIDQREGSKNFTYLS
jgi:hypothetical protein